MSLGRRNLTLLAWWCCCCFLLSLSGVAAQDADGVDCEWKYKCEEVLQSEPFICGRWSPNVEKICPQAAQKQQEQPDEDVGTFTPFSMIKAPCTAPYAEDHQGKCRLVFA